MYIAPLLKYLTLKALRYGSHSVTCKLHRKHSPDGASQTEVADI